MTRRVPLLDVNVLLALAWPNHVHHESAHAWFAGVDSWATCPITQSGFIRVSSNPRANPEARSPAEARDVLARIVSRPGHRFWADAVELATTDAPALERVVSYRQVTDAHLLAVAARHEGSLATFDRGALDLIPDGAPGEAVVLLVP